MTRYLLDKEGCLIGVGVGIVVNRGELLDILALSVDFSGSRDTLCCEFLVGLDVIENCGRVAVTRKAFNLKAGVYKGIATGEGIVLGACKEGIITDGYGQLLGYVAKKLCLS